MIDILPSEDESSQIRCQPNPGQTHSLGNLEVRTRIESETGIRIKSTDITTVRGLAEHVCDTLTAQALPETM